MAISFSTASSRLAANAAAVATAMAGGTTAAEVTALSQFLAAAGLKPGLSVEILRLINNVQLTENRP